MFGWRRLRGAISCIILSILCVAVFFLTDPAKVTCGGDVMSQGDTCQHTKNGRTTSENDFATEQRNQVLMKWGAGIAAFPLAGFGIFLLVGGSRKKSSYSFKPGNQPGYPPVGGQPGNAYPQQPYGNNAYPPQPGYPQQPGYPPAQGYPYQPQGGQQPGPGYPPQQPYGNNAYPPQPGYPPAQSYPQQPGYPPAQGYPQQPGRGYPPQPQQYPPQNYPPQQ